MFHFEEASGHALIIDDAISYENDSSTGQCNDDAISVISSMQLYKDVQC